MYVLVIMNVQMVLTDLRGLRYLNCIFDLLFTYKDENDLFIILIIYNVPTEHLEVSMVFSLEFILFIKWKYIVYRSVYNILLRSYINAIDNSWVYL